MGFSIFSGSAFLSIIMKCWDLENLWKTWEMEWNYSTITSFCIQYCIKKLVLVDFLFCLLQIVRALKIFYFLFLSVLLMFCREDLFSLNQIYRYASSESD